MLPSSDSTALLTLSIRWKISQAAVRLRRKAMRQEDRSGSSFTGNGVAATASFS